MQEGTCLYEGTDSGEGDLYLTCGAHDPMNPWPRIDELIERAKTVSDLHAHRLHLYAAWRWRSVGRPVPAELVELERGARIFRLAVPAIVRRVRDAYDGTLILLKGADVAAQYPRPELRPSIDLDFLVPDPERTQRALVAAGFNELPDTCTPDEHHHLPALEWPGLLVRVELHSTPSWPTWLPPPPLGELFASATTASALGHGVLALPPPHQALVLAAHMWREVPLARLGQLIDVLLMAQAAPVGETESLARRWGIDRLWRVTDATARSVLLPDRIAGGAPRIWTRGLESMRERTVIEAKVAQLMGPFLALPTRKAVTAAARMAGSELRPSGDETWGGMARRTLGALRQGFRRRSARDRELEAAAETGPVVAAPTPDRTAGEG
jgi:Uncharacterised nucleotidyltransferase